MTGIVSVYATFGSEEEARRIARIAVDERLAACANIFPCRSIYRWRDEVQETAEVAAIFKTGEATAGALIERIAALHSYAVPAAVVWPVDDAFPAYAEWVVENSR